MATTAQELRLRRQAFNPAVTVEAPSERPRVGVGGRIKSAGRTVARCVAVLATPRRQHFDTLDNINFAQMQGWGRNRR